MALINCPECEKQISDKAINCPHCGYPIELLKKAHAKSTTTTKKKAKRLKLPNGFGQITEIKNKNLRNPFRASKTVGKNKDRKLISKIIGYYSSYNEAYQALMDYNKNPYDLSIKEPLFNDIYEKWTDEYFKTLNSDNSQRSIKSAFNYSAPLHFMKIREIRVYHLEDTINNAKVGYSIKSRMKSMYNLMYDWACKHEYTDKNYARLFSIKGIENLKEKEKKEIVILNDDEIKLLWDNVNIPSVKMILVQLYTGLRPQEVAILETENIHLSERYLTGGIKTDAGKNRLIPIHKDILPLIESSMSNNKFLFYDDNGLEMTYDKYYNRFIKVTKTFNMNHRPHEVRHTFITKAKKSGVDENMLKYIVGHEVYDITEKVYTHRSLEDFLREIDKIKIL